MARARLLEKLEGNEPWPRRKRRGKLSSWKRRFWCVSLFRFSAAVRCNAVVPGMNVKEGVKRYFEIEGVVKMNFVR